MAAKGIKTERTPGAGRGRPGDVTEGTVGAQKGSPRFYRTPGQGQQL